MRIITLLISLALLSCQLTHRGPKYPVTPEVAVESTFKVDLVLDGQIQKSGTAWVVSYKKEHTYLVTAGHVCTTEVEIIPGIMGQIGYKTKTYKLTNYVNEEYTASDVAFEFSKYQDLCILKTKGYIADPIMMAKVDPVYNQPLHYVGAPLGHYGNGFAPTFQGKFCGARYFCGPTAPGASGSAVFTTEGVVGVLVTVDKRFHEIVGLVMRQDLIDYLYENDL